MRRSNRKLFEMVSRIPRDIERKEAPTIETQIKAIYRAQNGRLISILAPEQLFREDVMQRLAQGGGVMKSGAILRGGRDHRVNRITVVMA